MCVCVFVRALACVCVCARACVRACVRALTHLIKSPLCNTVENFCMEFFTGDVFFFFLENLTRVEEIECPYVFTFPC